MTSEPTSIKVWTPSPEQREVIERYAVGYRWYTASRECKVPDSTMCDWLLIPEFKPFGEEMRAELARTALPMYGAVVERAQKVQLRVKIADGDGDLSPTDPLVLWSERILRATLWPVLLIRGANGVGGGLQPRDALRLLDAGPISPLPTT